MLAISTMLIPLGVLCMQIVGFFVLISLIFDRQGKLLSWVGKHSVLLGFLSVLAASLGSLFYSNVIGFTPCYLCWWQRIFMYPQVLIFAVALWREHRRKLDKAMVASDVWAFTLPLTLAGIGISIYQNFLPLLEQAGIQCAEGDLCTRIYVQAFSYITIPVMALTVFGILILLAITNKVYAKK